MCKGIESLDLSFNKIKKIRGVKHLDNLKEIYFVQNRISTIENLVGLDRLRSLELGGNRIRAIEGLETLKALEELWLGKNKITEIMVWSAKAFSIRTTNIVPRDFPL